MKRLHRCQTRPFLFPPERGLNNFEDAAKELATQQLIYMHKITGIPKHKTKFRGVNRVRSQFTLALAAYNLIRLPRLLAGAPT